jgi:hypothetical protein
MEFIGIYLWLVVIFICTMCLVNLARNARSKKSRSAKNKRIRGLMDQFPGPSPTLPIFGNSLLFNCRPEDIGSTISALVIRHGKIFRFWLLTAPQTLIADRQLAKVILSTSFHVEKFVSYDALAGLIGRNGLITSEGVLFGTWPALMKVLSEYAIK